MSKPIEGVTIVNGNGVARSFWPDEQSAEKDKKTCESLGQTGLRLVHLREVVTCGGGCVMWTQCPGKRVGRCGEHGFMTEPTYYCADWHDSRADGERA